jgi:transcriptional regulator with XRE-family HTH domain
MNLTRTGTKEARRQSEARQPSLDVATKAVLAKLHEKSPFSDQLQALSKDLRLRDRELMALAGVSRATLARWRKEGGNQCPPKLDDLRVIAIELIQSGALRPSSVAGWLRSRNRGLDWQRPLDVLRDKEEFPALLSAVEATCGGRVPVEKLPPSDAG